MYVWIISSVHCSTCGLLCDWDVDQGHCPLLHVRRGFIFYICFAMVRRMKQEGLKTGERFG